MTQNIPDYASPPYRQRKWTKGLFGWVLFVALAVMLIMLLNRNQNRAYIPLSAFRAAMDGDQVRWVSIGKDEINGAFFTPRTINGKPVIDFHCPLPEGLAGNWQFVQWVLEHAERRGIDVDVEKTDNLLTNILVPLIPWLLIFLFIWFFVFRQLRKNAATTRTPVPVTVVSADVPIANRAGGGA